MLGPVPQPCVPQRPSVAHRAPARLCGLGLVLLSSMGCFHYRTSGNVRNEGAFRGRLVTPPVGPDPRLEHVRAGVLLSGLLRPGRPVSACHREESESLPARAHACACLAVTRF